MGHTHRGDGKARITPLTPSWTSSVPPRAIPRHCRRPAKRHPGRSPPAAANSRNYRLIREPEPNPIEAPQDVVKGGIDIQPRIGLRRRFRRDANGSEIAPPHNIKSDVIYAAGSSQPSIAIRATKPGARRQRPRNTIIYLILLNNAPKPPPHQAHQEQPGKPKLTKYHQSKRYKQSAYLKNGLRS